MTDFNLDSFHLSGQDSEAFYLVKTIKLNGSFPGGSDSKESACNAGDLCSIPGLGKSPGEGNGNPLQNSCLKNSMDRGAWQATVHWVTESGMTERLSLIHCSEHHPTG